MKIVLFEPPARTSNESDHWGSLPGVELTVVSDRTGWGADREIALPVRRVPVVGRQEGWTATIAWLRGVEEANLGAPDAVVSLELFSVSSSQAAKAATRLGVPHIIAIAETMIDNPLHRFPPYRQLTRRHARTADGFVCLTDLAREYAIAQGCAPERCVTVRPGVDTREFHPRPEGLVSDPIVLFVGMLRADRGADKGVVDVVEACTRLDDIDGLRLRLVGDGHLRPQLEKEAERLSFLEVVGRLPRDEIAEVMRASRCLVLPSRRTWKWEEQFGYVLVEAMACGLPVVATSSGAIREIVHPGSPLADEADPIGLARGLRRALGPDGVELGRDNRQRVLDHFDLGRQGELLRQALAGLIGRHLAR